LAIWENKIACAPLRSSRFWAPKHFLGIMTSVVKLPTPITTKPGKLGIYLVPAGLRGKEWISEPGVGVVKAALSDVSGLQDDLVDEVEFVFGTVPAGEYFVKAIWDRRLPLIDARSASPGDYESDFIGPLNLTRGTVMTNVVVECTNRVAGGEGYYEADAILRAK
jgi:hypothetical protein